MQASTTKRPGVSLNSFSNGEKGASKDPNGADWGANLADWGSPSGNDNHIRLAATDAFWESAIESPTMSWPSYERLYNVVRVAHLTHKALHTTPLRDFGPDAVFPRQRGVDLVSKASYEYVAERVDPSEFWMLNGKWAQITPLAI